MSEHLLSVIVPVFNEANNLKTIVPYLMETPCPIQREWIFVDDCSEDNSHELLLEFQKKYSFKLLRQEKNRGKGAAVIKGIELATGDLIMIQDADYEYEPKDIPELIKPILNDAADVVYGSRFKKTNPQVHRTYHYFVNRQLTILSNLLSGIYLTDMETCYKIFKADLLKAMQLQSKRFGIEVELTAYIAKTAARVFELPIAYYPRTRLQGKKINWKDGVAAIYHLLRFNLSTSFETAFKNLPDAYHPQQRHSQRKIGNS